MYPDGNQISSELREKLRNFQWSANSFLDLHSLGVHYWTPEYLPTWLDPMTYATLWRRGLTPPNALPIYTDENTHVRIKQFIDDNFYKLHLAGLPYLGNEANLQRAEDFDKKPIRMCFVRLSDYHTLDGAFGGQLINNFIQNFSDEVFADFSWIVAPPDVPKFMQAGLPIMFGNITKRPLTDFDIIVIATSYPGERVNAPLSLVRSGLPMYRWERFDDNLPYKARCPLVTVAGIGASFIENQLADHPIKGAGQNALFDHVLIGEGEVMDFKYVIEYLNTVKRDGQSKEAFMAKMTNDRHPGVYDPTRVYFEYADKVHILRDYKGQEISRKVYPAAGHIKRISLLDHETRTKHVLVGPESEEFRDMEAVNEMYHLRLAANVRPEDLGRKYVRISDKPTLSQRISEGMTDDRTKPKTIIPIAQAKP